MYSCTQSLRTVHVEKKIFFNNCGFRQTTDPFYPLHRHVYYYCLLLQPSVYKAACHCAMCMRISKVQKKAAQFRDRAAGLLCSWPLTHIMSAMLAQSRQRDCDKLQQS